jgi:hypothetical protein
MPLNKGCKVVADSGTCILGMSPHPLALPIGKHKVNVIVNFIAELLWTYVDYKLEDPSSFLEGTFTDVRGPSNTLGNFSKCFMFLEWHCHWVWWDNKEEVELCGLWIGIYGEGDE